MGDHEDIIIEDTLVEDAAEAAPAAAPVKLEGKTVWRVKVLYSSSTEFCEAPPGLDAKVGDLVVIPTRYGNELGRILGREIDPSAITSELRTIVRAASAGDLLLVEENDTREERAFETCREKIEARGLSMKLVSAHYILDEQKILFFFTAENRVDFRELVRDLVAVFKMRIELRQIGVRDEARVVGGLGICGRALCCNAVTDRLRPVSIKMAKEQNLTLNSMKISGPCGRLLCCLSYEFDTYREIRQGLPGMGTRVQFDGEEFKVTDMNVLTRRLRLQGQSGRVLDVGFDALSRNQQTQGWELHVRAGSDSEETR
ncbi:MAG TPA: stage 0 sporulation family protein [Spirochaetia bacterium]|nr:stage 0 sporulation family protein [Spirochaetia bacterium]